jgi:hypothetical protein
MSSDTPIACRLSDSEFRKREATLLTEFKSAVMTTEELHDGYVFRVSGDAKSLAVVTELIAAERECCPFLTFELTVPSSMGPLVVGVRGPSGAKDFLRAILCNPESGSDT